PVRFLAGEGRRPGRAASSVRRAASGPSQDSPGAQLMRPVEHFALKRHDSSAGSRLESGKDRVRPGQGLRSWREDLVDDWYLCGMNRHLGPKAIATSGG